MLDLGAASAAGVWGPTVPTDGTTPGEHATSLFQVLRQLPAGVEDGPEARLLDRCLMMGLRMLVLDPQGPPPLTQLPALFEAEGDLREAIVARVATVDPAVHAFARQEIPSLLRRGVAGLPVDVWMKVRLSPLLDDPAVRRVTDTDVSHQGFAGLRYRRHLVLSLPHDEMTDPGTSALGLLAVGLLRRTLRTTSRVHVFVDGWRRFVSTELEVLLAQGHREGWCIHVAEQSLVPLPPTHVQTTFTNLGSLAAFRVGPDDARLVAPLFDGIDADELVALDDRTIVVGTPALPFIVDTPAPYDAFRTDPLRRLHEATVAGIRRTEPSDDRPVIVDPDPRRTEGAA